MRVAWPDVSTENLESFGEQLGVAVRAVGHAARRAKRPMDLAMHLSPKGADAGQIVNILDDDHCREVGVSDIFIPADPVGHGASRRFGGFYPGDPGHSNHRL
jgi:hypothetical protein